MNWEKYWADHLRDFKNSRPAFLERLRSYECPSGMENVLAEAAAHITSGGKHMRGVLVAATLDALNQPDSPDQKLVQCAHLTGWCIEMLHAGFLVLDDLIDGSSTRHGKPTWHRIQKDVCDGLVAVNDGVHLILASKYLLHEILSPVPVDKMRLMRLMDEVSYQTCWGQCLDIRYAVGSRSQPVIANWDSFNHTILDQIYDRKTALYSFYMPIACGLCISGVRSEVVYRYTKGISLKLGRLFQAQDDFLDVFGDDRITGKIGVDIMDGKMTWLIVECLKRASPDQASQIRENFGRSDPVAQSRVLQVYIDLGLPEIFKDYEIRMRSEILQDIKSHNLDNLGCLPNLFSWLVEILCGRSS